MPDVTLGDVTLHYEDQGSGTPVLFIHGVWMSSRFFQPQLDGLSDRCRVLSLDMRAHGQSARMHSGHTVAQYARDVHAFIEHMGLSEVVLAGWSMGAFVIWEYIKEFEGKYLKGTVIIDESASDFRWPDWPYGFADLPALAHIMSAIQTDRSAFVRGFIPAMFKDSPSDEDAAWMFAEITRMPESVASAILFDQTVQDYRPMLDKVTLPTLLCFGRDEKLISVAAGEHLAQHMPNARLVVFEASSHCPFLEEPQHFNDEVASFVQSLE